LDPSLQLAQTTFRVKSKTANQSPAVGSEQPIEVPHLEREF